MRIISSFSKGVHGRFIQWVAIDMNGVYKKYKHWTDERSLVCELSRKELDSIADLDFVHGSPSSLLEGNPAVIRNKMEFYTPTDQKLTALFDGSDVERTIDVYKTIEFCGYDSNLNWFDNRPFKSVSVKEGKLIFLNKTKSGNWKVVLKKY